MKQSLYRSVLDVGIAIHEYEESLSLLFPFGEECEKVTVPLFQWAAVNSLALQVEFLLHVTGFRFRVVAGLARSVCCDYPGSVVAATEGHP